MSTIVWPALLMHRLKLKSAEGVQNILITYQSEDACFCMKFMHDILCTLSSARTVWASNAPA